MGVTQVVFYDGATVIGTDNTAPYSVTAKADDPAGNVMTSAPVSVKVN